MRTPGMHFGLAIMVAAALLTVSVARVDAHEKGVLRLSSKTFGAGDSLQVDGDRFGHRAVLKIELVGMGGETRLAQVTADTLGRFHMTLLIPTVAPGPYRVVAIASDGDAVSSVDVTVGSQRSAVSAPKGGDDARPTARPLAIARAHDRRLAAVIGSLAVAALLGGGALVRLGTAPAPPQGRGVDVSRAAPGRGP